MLFLALYIQMTNVLISSAATAVTATVIAAHDKDTTETTKTPLKEKRTSRFGSVSNIFGSGKKTTDVKPTTEPIATEAPKVDSAVESGAPLTESVPTGAATAAPIATAHAPVVETAPVVSEPAVVPTAATTSTSEPKKLAEKSTNRSGGLKGFFAKKEAQIENKSEEKKIEKEEKKAVESTTDATPILGGVGTTPFVQSIIPGAAATTHSATEPAVATTAAATPVVDSAATTVAPTKKEERRRSIFDTFKSKPKPVSDSKDITTGETSSPAGVDESKEKKIFNLFRSSSKKANHESVPSTTAAGAPPVPAKDAEVPLLAGSTATDSAVAKTEAPIIAETKPEVSSVAADAPIEHAAA